MEESWFEIESWDLRANGRSWQKEIRRKIDTEEEALTLCRSWRKSYKIPLRVIKVCCTKTVVKEY